jgi:hypothetical protein
MQAVVASVLHIMLREVLQYLQNVVQKGDLGAFQDDIFGSSYTAAGTLWKVETTVSNV